MAKVRVTKPITVRIGETATVHYDAGFEGTAKADHIAKIVEAGCGERIDRKADDPPESETGEGA